MLKDIEKKEKSEILGKFIRFCFLIGLLLISFDRHVETGSFGLHGAPVLILPLVLIGAYIIGKAIVCYRKWLLDVNDHIKNRSSLLKKSKAARFVFDTAFIVVLSFATICVLFMLLFICFLVSCLSNPDLPK